MKINSMIFYLVASSTALMVAPALASAISYSPGTATITTDGLQRIICIKISAAYR